MGDGPRNVFISHIHEDDPGLSDLKNLLKSGGMDVRDGSINSANPNNAKDENYIKYQVLAPRIQWCSVLIVYISPETHTSQYVNWEIEYAHQLGKQIVGVWEQNAKGCTIPEALENYHDAIVGWNSQRIIDAIEGKLKTSEGPDCVPRPARELRRHPC